MGIPQIKEERMGQELREKIAEINCTYCDHEPPICDELCNAAYEHADLIIALIKEAGYQTHEEVQGLVDIAIIRARAGYHLI